MRSFDAWKRKQLKDPEVKAAYDALEDEFALIGELLGARSKAKLSQAQVAKRMGTSQSAVARIESGRSPSLTSLRRYAKAVGSKLEIRLEYRTTQQETVMSGKNRDQFYIERRDAGDYAVRRGGADRASAVERTQGEAIDRAREISPDTPIHVERVRDTNVGHRDKWRKP